MILLGFVPPACTVNIDVKPIEVKCNFSGAKIRIEGNYIIVEAP